MPTVSLTLPTSGTVVSAGLHSSNYSDLQTLLNGGLDNDNFAAGVLDAVLPAGAILPYAGSAAPTGWLLCDGASYATATYASLFAVTGYQYGGSGANFNVPNIKGKVVVGIDAAQGEFDVRGETGGAKTHTLSTAELASHTHPVTGAPGISDPGHLHAYDVADGAGATPVPQGGSNTSGTNTRNTRTNTTGITATLGTLGTSGAGSGSAHNNLQPYIALHHIIKT